MMGLRSARVKRLEIPGEPGQWVDVIPLTGPQMEAAKWMHVRAMAERIKGLDLDGFRQFKSAEDAPVQTTGYDRAYLVDNAVVAWSYDVDLVEGKEPSDVLDAETFDFLAREVEAMNTRPLVTEQPSATN